MKDYVLELVSQKKEYHAKINTMREYLQSFILRIMRVEGVFRATAFRGDTALRFLHDLPRFSEVLDFAAVKGIELDFGKLLANLKKELTFAGFDVKLAYNDQKAVQTAFVRFSGLLFEAGISSVKGRKFAIQIELDTSPPEGGRWGTKIAHKYFPISFVAYDIPSLFADKLYALISQKHPRGRDYFDLYWCCSKWKDIQPNISLLCNALRRINFPGTLPTESTWRNMVCEFVQRSDWGKVVGDVAVFLDSSDSLKTFTQENVLKVIKGG